MNKIKIYIVKKILLDLLSIYIKLGDGLIFEPYKGDRLKRILDIEAALTKMIDDISVDFENYRM